MNKINTELIYEQLQLTIQKVVSTILTVIGCSGVYVDSSVGGWMS